MQTDLKSRVRTAVGFDLLATIGSGEGPLGHNYTWKNIGGSPEFGRNFYVEVTLYRQSDSAHVGFVGFAIIFK